MTPERGEKARHEYTLWRVIAWISFAVLAVCVLTGLFATLPRLQATFDLIDDPDGSPVAYEEKVAAFMQTAKLSLVVGAPAAVVFMIARIMASRARRRQDSR